jgi:drug/metabolite transporter (DMT)-like permease
LTPILLALGSAVLFGAMTVALRIALRAVPEPDLGAVVSTVAAVVVAAAATVAEPGTGELARPRELAVFALAGLLAPGISQILFVLGVRDAGAARTAVVVGSAPLFAATLAIVLLDEPFVWALALGAGMIVGAGALLAREASRPVGFRLVGVLFALGATIAFSTRDTLVRWYSSESALGSVEAATAALVAGTLVMVGYSVALRRGAFLRDLSRPALLRFVPAGVLFGAAYVLLIEAYYRGKVTVVSPIVATESLWAVLLAALFLRRSELVGPRLLLGALLVVVGGALIGAYR